MIDVDVSELLEASKKLGAAFAQMMANVVKLPGVIPEKTKNARDQIGKSCYKGLNEEYSAFQVERIQFLFSEAVDKFYDAYSPSYYSRRYSLDNVLSMSYYSDTGQVVYDPPYYDALYDTSGLTGRNGCSLYELVFVEGYHGGAWSGQAGITDHHPTPGVPYYRRPGWITTSSGAHYRGRYGKWGRPAIQTDSVRDMMAEQMNANESYFDQMYDEIYEKWNEKCVSDITKIVNEAIEEAIMEGVDFNFG